MTTLQLRIPWRKGMYVSACTQRDMAGSVSSRPLETEWLRDAIYVPKIQGKTFDDDSEYGLYRSDGSLCELGAYRRGVDDGLVGQSQKTGLDASLLPCADDHLYVYVGPRFYTHFGHFLVSTLPRLWPRLHRRHGVKFLVQGERDPGEWFKLSFVSEILSALSLTQEDFIHFEKPCRITNVLVPEPAFTELGRANHAFAGFGRSVGADIIRPKPRVPAPVYISKSKVVSGVWRFSNEMVLEAALAAKGVQIIHPELLTVSDQLGILESASCVISTLCSALHLCILASKPINIVALAPSPEIVENYLLVDQLAALNSSYVHPLHATLLGPDGHFQSNVLLEHPEEVAAELLDLVLDL